MGTTVGAAFPMSTAPSILDVTFSLNTTPQAFAGWFENYAKSLSREPSLVELLRLYGTVTLAREPSILTGKPLPEHLVDLKLEIRCCYYPDPHSGKLQTAYFQLDPEDHSLFPAGFSAIHLYIQVLDSERLKVTARCCLPDATDVFAHLLRKIAERWEEARESIMAPKVLAALQPAVSPAEWVKWESMVDTLGDETGQPTATEHIPTPEQYVFRKRGETWEIAYGGEAFSLRDIKGLNYIAFLLSYPSREFKVLELVAAVEKAHSEGGIKLDRDENGWEGGSVSVSDGSDDYEILPKEARDDYKKRLRELGEERQQAEERGDETELQVIDRKAERIGRELQSATGLFERKRGFPVSHERARTKVQKQIKAAVDKISKHVPTLAEYLVRTIRTGSECSYWPDQNMPISWEL